MLVPRIANATGGLAFLGAEFDGVGGISGLDGARSVAVSPDGAHIYVAGFNGGTLVVFGRNATSGTVSYVETQTAGFGGVGAAAVAVSPDGAHVYAVGFYSSTLVVFSRNATTGALALVEVQTDGVGGVDGMSGADGVIVSPDGAHVYAVGLLGNGVAVFARNITTGALTFVEALKDDVGGVDGLGFADAVAVSPDGAHLYVGGQSDNAVAVFARNVTTGALTFVEVQTDGIGGVDGLAGASAVAVSPDGGHVYVSGLDDDAIAVFSRNATTGGLSFSEVQKNGIGSVSGLARATAVTVSPDGGRVYATGLNDNAVVVFSRNMTTGALTFIEKHVDEVPPDNGLGGASSVALSADGRHAYVGSAFDDAVARFRVITCGDDFTDAGEQCDDGNSVGGDCCAATCTFEATGEACTSDNSLCTGDSCDGAGTCIHAAQPDPTCLLPLDSRGATLKILKKTGDRPDQVQFRWGKGPAVPKSEFGIPPGGTPFYELCLYDVMTGVPSQFFRAQANAGPICDGIEECWSEKPTGWNMKWKAATPDGITSVKLKEGTTPRTAKLAVMARRTSLVGSLPLTQDPRVVAQLRTTDGKCWGGVFSTAAKNDTRRFSARSD